MNEAAILFRCPKCRVTLKTQLSDWPVSCCGTTYETPHDLPRVIPSLATRAKNLARDSYKHKASGSKLVSDEVRQWRLDQCEACDLYFDKITRICSHPKCGCGMRKERGFLDALGWASKQCPIGRWQRPPWITLADLTRDTVALANKIPRDVSAIVGIPRSGMLPASILATHLHLPLFSLREDGVYNVGCGYRLSDANKQELSGRVLVVDDTSMGGTAAARAKEQWKTYGQGSEAIFAVIYCSPKRRHVHGPMPDLWQIDLEEPHLLEWNFFNSGYVPSTAFDFDGVFTKQDTNEPLYLPRKYVVPLIVTGRLERDRAGTEAWLREHGVRWSRMEMWQGTLEQRDRPKAISLYKAKHFVESGLRFFCESEPDQAREIAGMTGKIVICPTNGKVY